MGFKIYEAEGFEEEVLDSYNCEPEDAIFILLELLEASKLEVVRKSAPSWNNAYEIRPIAKRSKNE